MSGAGWAVVVAAVLLVVAGFVGVRTWRTRRTTVLWMRPVDGRIAHAIPKAELRAELADVQPIARCDRLPLVDLVRDDGAERCAACVRAVERMEHRHNE